MEASIRQNLRITSLSVAGALAALFLAAPPPAAGVAVPVLDAPARFSTTVSVIPRYYRRILFRFQWGNGDGQVGLLRPEETVTEVPVEGGDPPPPPRPARDRSGSFPSGPDKLAVDTRGNVFLHDPVNRRTLIWDRKVGRLSVFPSAFPFSRACFFDGGFVWAVTDSSDGVGRIEKTRLSTGEREVIEFDQSGGALMFDGLSVAPGGLITLESPRNGKLALVDLYAEKVRVAVGGEERLVYPLAVEPLLREGEGGQEIEAGPFPPWSVDDPHLSLYQGGMTIVSGDQVKVDGKGRIYLRLVKARDEAFHREFLQCYNARGGFLWEAPLDRSEMLYPEIEKGALVDVDRRGDVYQLVVRSQGAELVQWDWGWGR